MCDEVVAPAVFAAVREDVAQFGGASLMTEGLWCPDAAMGECREVMRQLDQNLLSWTDWRFAGNIPWQPSPVQEEAWARVFARAVAGQPINMTFNATAGALVRVWVRGWCVRVRVWVRVRVREWVRGCMCGCVGAFRLWFR